MTLVDEDNTTHTHNKASSRVEGCLKCDAGEGNEHIQNTQEVRTLSYVCVRSLLVRAAYYVLRTWKVKKLMLTK